MVVVDQVENENLGDRECSMEDLDDEVFEDGDSYEQEVRKILTGTCLEKSNARKKRRDEVTDLLQWGNVGRDKDDEELVGILEFLEKNNGQEVQEPGVDRCAKVTYKVQTKVTDWITRVPRQNMCTNSDSEGKEVRSKSKNKKGRQLLMEDPNTEGKR